MLNEEARSEEAKTEASTVLKKIHQDGGVLGSSTRVLELAVASLYLGC